MSGQATIVAAGTVTISTTGAQSGVALSRITNLVNNAAAVGNLFSSDPNTTSTAISAPNPYAQGATYALSDGYQGTLTLPTGYSALVVGNGTNVTVSGGDPTTEIASAGQLTYDGSSNALTSFGDNSALSDSGDLASLAIGGSNVAVTLGGASQTLNIDAGASVTINETSIGGRIVDAGSVRGAAAAPVMNAASSVPGAASLYQLTADTSVELNDATAASTLVLRSGADTVSATAGTNTVLATTGNDVYFGSSAKTFFVGATGTTVAVSTIFGGQAGDTVFAQSGVNYTEGGGNNLYIGGSYADLGGAAASVAAHSTVTATSGHDLLFGGTVGDQYNLGNGSETFVAGGGADTLFGGSVAPTIFSGANETLKLVGTNAGLVVANGDNDVIDASQSDQGNTFFAANLPGVGNTTLIGSTGNASLSGAHDTFVIGQVTSTVTAPAAAHTVTIDNFHTGDAFFLTGYSVADGATFEAAVASTDAANIKAGTPTGNGSLSFTLSDNTTVTFTNSHPTTAFNGGTVGL